MGRPLEPGVPGTGTTAPRGPLSEVLYRQVYGLVLGGGWLVLAVVGLVPLAAGVFDFCLAAPLVHQPLRSAHGQGS